MNIQTVVRMEGYAVPGGSSYLYGTTPQRAVAAAPPVERIEIPGPREMDVVYQYRVLEGWQGEIPLSLTYLVATRSYSQSVVVYQSQDWNKSRFWLA